MNKTRLSYLQPQGPGSSQAIWVTIYSDMITSIMVFFLILWSYTEFGKAQVKDNSAPVQVQDLTLRQEIKQELEQVGTVVVTGKRITVTLPSAVLFGSGSAKLTGPAQESLAKVAEALAKSQAPIVVEGHTDNVPINNSQWRSNYQLSAARAFSVIQFLTGAKLISPDRLAARGYGPFQPLAENNSNENKAKNRRIEIHLLQG